VGVESPHGELSQNSFSLFFFFPIYARFNAVLGRRLFSGQNASDTFLGSRVIESKETICLKYYVFLFMYPI